MLGTETLITTAGIVTFVMSACLVFKAAELTITATVRAIGRIEQRSEAGAAE